MSFHHRHGGAIFPQGDQVEELADDRQGKRETPGCRWSIGRRRKSHLGENQMILGIGLMVSVYLIF
jgi:hypothetical protein